MRLLDRLSPRLRDYVREEYCRIWTRREYGTLLFALVVVEVMRVVATWISLAGQTSPGRTPVDLLSMTGFTSWLIFVYRFGGRMAMPAWSWPFGVASELLSLFSVILPYYSGRSIAPVRKYRELEELEASGLSEREILLGRGLAHLWPFLLVLVLSTCVAVVQAGVGMMLTRRGMWSISLTSTGHLPWRFLLILLVSPVGSLARMATFVCASALTRRVWSGVAICYGLSLLFFPAVSTAIRIGCQTAIPSGNMPTAYLTQIVLPAVLTTVVECVLLVPLYLAAERVLAGRPLIRPLKLQSRSLWLAEEEEPAREA